MLFHLGRHQGERVCPGWGEVFLEPSLVDEGHVRLENVVGRLAVENAHEESNHTLGDQAVGVGCEGHRPPFKGRVEPDLRLASLDEPIRSLKLFGHGRKFLAEVDDVLIPLGPVLEEVKFVEELLLFFGNGHLLAGSNTSQRVLQRLFTRASGPLW